MYSPTFLSCLLTLPLSVLAAPALQERADDPRFTLYDLPTPLTGPCDLEVGQDGALWGQGMEYNIFFRIDPDSGAITEYPIPFTTPLSAKPIPVPGVQEAVADRTALSCAIRKGDDGNLYASNGLRNQLVRINPFSKKIDLFDITPLNPLGDLQPFTTLAQTVSMFTTYTIPTPLSLPLGLFVASDGLVYIAELLANKILTFDPKTKAMHEYILPELAQFPTVIRAERNGYVYFALLVGNGIGRINMTTHKIDIYHTNQVGLLGAEDTIDKYGGVWYSPFTADVLSRLDTNTLKFGYVPFPDTFASTLKLNGITGAIPPYVDVAINYGPGDAIWFTSIVTNQVGRYDISGFYS